LNESFESSFEATSPTSTNSSVKPANWRQRSQSARKIDSSDNDSLNISITKSTKNSNNTNQNSSLEGPSDKTNKKSNKYKPGDDRLGKETNGAVDCKEISNKENTIDNIKNIGSGTSDNETAEAREQSLETINKTNDKVNEVIDSNISKSNDSTISENNLVSTS